MTAPYSNIAYAKLNLDYDKELFTYEYDRYILPRSQYIYNTARGRDLTLDLNRKWNMVDPNIYDNMDGIQFSSWEEKQNASLDVRGNKTWQQYTITQLVPSSDDDAALQDAGSRGLLAARNFARHREWQIKPEFAKLNTHIADFVFNRMCFERVMWINCVSLAPGRCAIIHRDNMRLYSHGENPTLNNGLARDGFVVVCLNISDGGVPLYWSLDGADSDQPRFINDACYMNSDYFWHGVPVVSGRRRQIRITGIPGAGFDQLIDYSSAVVIPEDYVFDSGQEPSMY